MADQKLHVEIGMDGWKTVSVLQGNALELMTAACRILNIFYQTFETKGNGEEFKEAIREVANRDDHLVWTHKD